MQYKYYVIITYLSLYLCVQLKLRSDKLIKILFALCNISRVGITKYIIHEKSKTAMIIVNVCIRIWMFIIYIYYNSKISTIIQHIL